MKRIKDRPGIAFLNFSLILGFVIVSITSCVGRREAPPCHGCHAAYASVRADTPTLTFCELRDNRQRYRDQVVRVQAYFVNDAGYTSLFDRACAEGQWISAGFGQGYAACDGTPKALSLHCGLGTWYDGAAKVVIVGRYGLIDDQRGFRDKEEGFTILCLEQVEPERLGLAVAINKVRYTIGRMGRLVFGK